MDIDKARLQIGHSKLRVFTIRELVDSIRKNGLEQIRGHYFGMPEHQTSTNDVVGFWRNSIGQACALGQASINLGVKPANTWWDEDGNKSEIVADIMTMNDDENLTFEQIATAAEVQWKDYMDAEIAAPIFDYTPFLEIKNA